MQLSNDDFTRMKAKLEGFVDNQTTTLGEIKERLREVEQKQAHRPFFGNSGSGGGSGAIVDAIRNSSQFHMLQKGELRECRISLPAGALSTKTILGPNTPGAAALQAPDRAGEMVGFAQRRMTVRALLPSLTTDSGATQYTRLVSFGNAAAPQGATSSPFQIEGETKAESGMVFELVTSPIATIAHWLGASDQVLSDMPALERFVDVWLRYGLSLVEEDQLLNGSGVGANLSGLLTLATAFDGGATNQTALDTLRKACTQLQVAEHVPNGIVVNPVDWAAIEMLKATDGQYLTTTLNVNGSPSVWRVPVVVTNAIAQNTFLVGDFASALVRDRQQATIEISNSHADFFTRNLVAIRAELREGLEVHRPAGFVTGQLDYAG